MPPRFGIQAPKCARCEKSVYQAEQVIGPFGKAYHKPCLTCMGCNKRLDSTLLVEHEGEAWCKNCHKAHFGQGKGGFATAVPLRPDPSPSLGSEPGSPRSPRTRNVELPPVPSATRPVPPPKPAFKPSYTSQPAPTPVAPPTPPHEAPTTEFDPAPSRAPAWSPPASPQRRSVRLSSQNHSPDPARSGGDQKSRAGGATIGTVSLGADGLPPPKRYVPGPSLGSPRSESNSAPRVPSMSAGVTRAGLGSSIAAAGGGTPLCARCSKPVYFAEQKVAAGRKWHGACLRCDGCSTTLTSGKLEEGPPAAAYSGGANTWCRVCYAKNFGPKGIGVAGISLPETGR